MRRQHEDESDEREIFETIRASHRFAPEPEQRAMVEQLRHHLPTIPSSERMSLIDNIERGIGENLEWLEPESDPQVVCPSSRSRRLFQGQPVLTV